MPVLLAVPAAAAATVGMVACPEILPVQCRRRSINAATPLSPPLQMGGRDRPAAGQSLFLDKKEGA